VNKHLLPFSILMACCIGNAQKLPQPEALLCELLREPAEAVITDSTPEFGWVFPQSGMEQSACRILVASSPFCLKEDRADYWDSGKILSQRSVNVSYAGSPLKENSIFWFYSFIMFTDNHFIHFFSRFKRFDRV